MWVVLCKSLFATQVHANECEHLNWINIAGVQKLL
jgi:hypothetical protein